MSMPSAYAVLPCNGLDKLAGVLSREIALVIANDAGGEIVCPVLLNAVKDRYAKTLSEHPLLVIDGCGTRCASKLAAALDLAVARKALVTDLAKDAGHALPDSLVSSVDDMIFVRACVGDILRSAAEQAEQEDSVEFSSPTEFITVTHDKYVFRIPSQGYFFSENDCWVCVIGDRARVGVTDYVQQNTTDITYFEPANVGVRVEQFDEIGALESAKTMLDVLSPVSGKVVAVNRALVDTPELINDDPYGKGWIAEVELADFEADRQLLLDSTAYARIVEKKAGEYA